MIILRFRRDLICTSEMRVNQVDNGLNSVNLVKPAETLDPEPWTLNPEACGEGSVQGSVVTMIKRRSHQQSNIFIFIF